MKYFNRETAVIAGDISDDVRYGGGEWVAYNASIVTVFASEDECLRYAVIHGCNVAYLPYGANFYEYIREREEDLQ